MNKINDSCLLPLEDLAEYQDIIRSIEKGDTPTVLTGCVDSQKSHAIYGFGNSRSIKVIVTYNEIRARELLEDCSFYDSNVLYFPGKDVIFYQADLNGTEVLAERMKVFRMLGEGSPCTIITTVDALMTPLIPSEQVLGHLLHIEKGSELIEEDIADTLTTLGYTRNYQVDAPGQFSIRGGIVDVFDLTEENPCRIELWGDQVESIRLFDLLSQRSIRELERITVFPAQEMILQPRQLKEGLARIKKDAASQEKALRSNMRNEEAGRLARGIREMIESIENFGVNLNLDGYINYFYDSTMYFQEFVKAIHQDILYYLDEPSRITDRAEQVEFEFRESMSHRIEGGYVLPGQADILCGSSAVYASLLRSAPVMLCTFGGPGSSLTGGQMCPVFDLGAKMTPSYHNSFDALVSDMEHFHKLKYRVCLISHSHSKGKRLAMDLSERGLNAFFTEDGSQPIQPGEIAIRCGSLKKGYQYPLLKLAVIAEGDIFTTAGPRKKTTKKYYGTAITDFSELHFGDYVVHENHGVGIYRGIEKITNRGITKDFIKIEYDGGGFLYVLASNFSCVQKHAASDAKRPKLNKLGSSSWENTKSKARRSIGNMAADLVKLYVERQEQHGFSFSHDTPWQEEFEELFPYDETPDQLKAIADTKRDMESPKIMDRLICGDVGFGKTEVAIRAAFKAVQDGKQVVVLVPTTILCQQHYNTFTQRMKDYPVRVDILCRFRTPAQQKETIAALKTGAVDIVIGTHRVLSKTISFKNLGLLIVDEEQRFGVSHKEKIKQLKSDVDVLSLSATPIPRTLHMSLVGIRDMSLLEDPPQDRMPIQTFVCEYDQEMVREAITRELSRHGQVYYVYNKVRDIADVSAKISSLVPSANVAFAHGQMKESELEQIMVDFINGEIDVLVSTTIVETGMDIPNVNTMIIHDADAMGLSQLYQLRGRVGRSNRIAYAFLFYRRDKLLKEVAEKRLQAIRDFTELGSGVKIAMRDLEIRGAGNVLGAEQSGHMEAVGYDLYCKMLGEALRILKGEDTVPDFETAVDLDVDAFIPDSYILNEVQKLEMYKRIAATSTLDECEDIKAELTDRFGDYPRPVKNLLRIAVIRQKAHALYLSEVKGKNQELKFTALPNAKLNAAAIPSLLQHFRGKLGFRAAGSNRVSVNQGIGRSGNYSSATKNEIPSPCFIAGYTKCGVAESDEEELLRLTEEYLSAMEDHLLENTLGDEMTDIMESDDNNIIDRKKKE